MGKIKSTLRNSRGMTLIEVMMALAVLGIVLVFIVNETDAYSCITANNLDQLRIMELARAEMEKIKANPSILATLDGTYNTAIPYPPEISPGEQIYSVKYKKITPLGISGDLCRITIGPSGSVPDPNNPENYNLLTWLPLIEPTEDIVSNQWINDPEIFIAV